MLKHSIFFLFSITQCFSQEFFTAGKKITDFNDKFHIDSIEIKIVGLPNKIDTSFGVSKICFNIEHRSISDLKIELLSPNGSSIWLTNRNGRENGENYLNTCFSSAGFNGYIHQGKAPFIGDYVPDGRLSFINNGQNPNGTWYLLIQDLKKGEAGTCNFVKMEFAPKPMPNNDKGICSIDHPELCKCSNKNSNCQLLPDLVVLPKFTKDQLEEFAQNDTNYPGQLRMAAAIANIGDGPMEVLGKGEWLNTLSEKVDSSVVDKLGNYARQIIYQRIQTKNNSNYLQAIDIKAGTNYFDDKPGHNHFHVDDWVVFRLLQKQADKTGKVKKHLIASELLPMGYWRMQ
jgi:subtilisin-like proprotein convertase family protein